MTKLLKSSYGNIEVPGEKNKVWGSEWESSDDEKEIVAFCCFGDSEEISEVITKIKEYQAGKDWILSHNQKSLHDTYDLKYDDKYKILNSQLKRDLKKILNEYNGDIDEKVENIEHFAEHLDSVEGVIKPIKPIKPIRPLGKSKDNEEWRRYNREIAQYHREMEQYSREM